MKHLYLLVGCFLVAVSITWAIIAVVKFGEISEAELFFGLVMEMFSGLFGINLIFNNLPR
jgi:hypothetical protein